MEAEELKKKKRPLLVNKTLIHDVKRDVDTGMFFSNLVMYFIILTAGVVLFPHGVHQIDTVEQAAGALKPVARKLAYYLFAAGVIGTGLLTIPVLCGSLSYIYSETFGWKGDLDKPLRKAKAFYAVVAVSLIVGLLINYIGISPIDALLYTAILYGITAPIMIVVVIRIGNNKKVMREFVNTRASNIKGWITFTIMTAAALFLLYTWLA